MKPIYALLLLLILPFSSLYATTFYSASTGAWTSGSTWSTIGCGQKSCGRIPGNGDSVIISSNYTVTLSSNLTLGEAGLPKNLTIQSGGDLNMDGKAITITSGTVLYLYGTLSADSISIESGADVEVSNTGAIIAHTFFGNNSNILVNGSISFSGNFTNNAGASITGNGGLFASGNYINNGTVFGASRGSFGNALLEATIATNANAKADHVKMVAGL